MWGIFGTFGRIEDEKLPLKVKLLLVTSRETSMVLKTKLNIFMTCQKNHVHGFNANIHEKHHSNILLILWSKDDYIKLMINIV